MQGNNELYKSSNFIIWRNDILGFYEKALEGALENQSSNTLDWTYANHILFVLQASIVKAYSPIGKLAKFMEKTEKKETLKELNEEYKMVEKSFREVLDSLVNVRMAAWSRSAHWSCVAAYFGAYEAVARELRFVIEDCIQALYMDQENPNDNLERKISVLEELEKNLDFLRGSNLIQAATLSCALKEKLKKLFWKLCNYVHPSSTQISKTLNDRSINFEYIPERFEESLQMFKETYDFVIVLVLTRFPNAFDKFLNDFDAMEMLEENDFRETIELCKGFRMSTKNP